MSQSSSSALQAQSFTQDAEIKAIRQEVADILARRRAADPDFAFSDYFDGENWYVDLVQEGGGVLGVALTGYTYILEQAHIRFLKLAGTSAGAINTLLMAAADVPSAPKSEKVIEHLAALNIASLVDGDDDVQNLIQTLNQEKQGFLELGYRFLRVLDDLKDHMGLNPGTEFFRWINGILQGWGIHNLGDLDRRMNTLPAVVTNALNRTRAQIADRDWLMAIIAADLSTQVKAVFPRMAPLYYADLDRINPADFVRASMSVPYFFFPWIKDGIPQDEATRALWRERTTYLGPHPEKALFVDGGLLSNFPIDVFHDWNRVPGRPTFGVKLGQDHADLNRVEDMTYTKLAGTMIDAATKIRDRDFITQHPDFNQLVATIDVGEHDWLNFNISDEAKLDLFRRGARAAREFLRTFDWNQYKGKRQDQLYALASNVLGIDLGDELDGAEMQHHARLNTDGATNTRSLGTTPVARSSTRSRAHLQQRMKFQYVYGEPFELLFISAANGESPRHEVSMIEAMRGRCTMVSSPEEAQGPLQQTPFQLIVLDQRGQSDLSRLQALKQATGAISQPRLLIYADEQHAAEGYPPDVFSVAYQPSELMHAIIDAMQRG